MVQQKKRINIIDSLMWKRLPDTKLPHCERDAFYFCYYTSKVAHGRFTIGSLTIMFSILGLASIQTLGTT